MGGSRPHPARFLGSFFQAHNPNGISNGSAVFAQMTAKCPYTSQSDATSLLKIAPGIWTPCNTYTPPETSAG